MLTNLTDWSEGFSRYGPVDPLHRPQPCHPRSARSNAGNETNERARNKVATSRTLRAHENDGKRGSGPGVPYTSVQLSSVYVSPMRGPTGPRGYVRAGHVEQTTTRWTACSNAFPTWQTTRLAPGRRGPHCGSAKSPDLDTRKPSSPGSTTCGVGVHLRSAAQPPGISGVPVELGVSHLPTRIPHSATGLLEVADLGSLQAMPTPPVGRKGYPTQPRKGYRQRSG
ncbi:hypothetical protein HD554DRAFT_371991 [Boletus coccyginus]|nr:hypothetical protein HD554DRAFT_371991 [Boletus coccyginus]